MTNTRFASTTPDISSDIYRVNGKELAVRVGYNVGSTSVGFLRKKSFEPLAQQLSVQQSSPAMAMDASANAPGSRPSLSSTIRTLEASLTDTAEVLDKVAQLESPNNGVSLLDAKNDLFRSYLQHTVFLILAKVRSLKLREGASQPPGDAVRKLVELRLYLERGVRPLEEKLKFSLYSTLQAADDAERKARAVQESRAGEGEAPGNQEDGDSDDDYRLPAVNSMKALRPGQPAQVEKSGVYRPPMTKSVLPPEARVRSREDRQPGKSATLEDYLATELSVLPESVPSIGTTILNRGRKVQTEFDRRAEAERIGYEERNFVRLPKESKKERAKMTKVTGRARMEFGGEEFRDLGRSADSIGRLTKRKDGATGTRALLEQSRKRKLGGGDGQVGMGDKYTKKLKRLNSADKRRK
jgi:U3 small nucleolar ribonucleoprotein protein LCP5